MNKKELFLPFMVIGLTLLFAGICIAVFLSNGKSKKWVARKMKIGGLLLSLTAITTVGGSGCVSCYDQPDNYPHIQFDNSYFNNFEININMDTGNVIKAALLPNGLQDFSFSIEDEDEQILQNGAVRIVDGTIDSYSEDIEVEIDNSLPVGVYSLRFFAEEASKQEDSWPFETIKLNVVNE